MRFFFAICGGGGGGGATLKTTGGLNFQKAENDSSTYNCLVWGKPFSSCHREMEPLWNRARSQRNSVHGCVGGKYGKTGI